MSAPLVHFHSLFTLLRRTTRFPFGLLLHLIPKARPRVVVYVPAALDALPPACPAQTCALVGARRVVLVAYNAEPGTIDRCYFRVTVKPYDVPRDVVDQVLRAHGRVRGVVCCGGRGKGRMSSRSQRVMSRGLIGRARSAPCAWTRLACGWRFGGLRSQSVR